MNFFFLVKNTNYIALCLLNISVKSGTPIQNDCSILKMGLFLQSFYEV